MPVPLDRGEHLPRQRARAPRARSTGTATNSEAAALLARVGLDENPVTPVGQLGVGKQQLVEIAKALSKEVKLLILDEPTAALNDNDSEHLLDLLRQLKAQGITSIIISHKLNEIAEIADTTTIIRDGRTVETLDMVADEVTAGAHHPRAWSAATSSTGSRRTSRTIGEEVLRIEDWTVHHPTEPDRVVVDGANLTVRARRDRRPRRAHGRRAHRARDERVRPLLRQRHHRPGLPARQGDPGRAPSPRRSTTASRTPPRTARSTASTSSRTSGATSPPRACRQVSRGGWVNGNEEIKVAEGYRAEHEHQGADGAGASRASSPAATSRRSC